MPLRVHDTIVRSAIEGHGGYVFALGGVSFCAAFSTTDDAAAAAIEAQEQLRDDTIVNFTVRMALHTGAASERDRNYYGTEVIRAARLMSLAHGGQVLVSAQPRCCCATTCICGHWVSTGSAVCTDGCRCTRSSSTDFRRTSRCSAAATLYAATSRSSSARSSAATRWSRRSRRSPSSSGPTG
jgi:hypothetical protein